MCHSYHDHHVAVNGEKANALVVASVLSHLVNSVRQNTVVGTSWSGIFVRQTPSTMVHVCMIYIYISSTARGRYARFVSWEQNVQRQFSCIDAVVLITRMQRWPSRYLYIYLYLFIYILSLGWKPWFRPECWCSWIFWTGIYLYMLRVPCPFHHERNADDWPHRTNVFDFCPMKTQRLTLERFSLCHTVIIVATFVSIGREWPTDDLSCIFWTRHGAPLIRWKHPEYDSLHSFIRWS